MSATPVVGLLFGGRPAAIAGSIRTVVVDALERHSQWGLAHIGEEILEDQPSFADRNAACAVGWEFKGFGIEAAGLHRAPASVRGRGRASWSVAVLETAFSENVSAPASAASRISSVQMIDVDDNFRAAVTLKNPMGYPVDVREAQDEKPSKAVACDIDEFGHGDLLQRLLCQGAASVSALCRPAFIAQMVL